jgi:hypothetical protein
MARLRQRSARPVRGLFFVEPGPNLQSLPEPLCRACLALPALRIARARERDSLRRLH